MKKLVVFVLALACALSLVGCESDRTTDTPALEEITGFTQKQLEDKLIGLSQEEIHHSWGEPDGQLSGFWGDIWQLNNERDEHIIIYYDDDGIVEHIIVSNHSG